MNVKLLVPICCPEGSFNKGAKVELSSKIAKGLIAGEYAIEIATEKNTPKVEELEAKQKETKKPAAKKPATKKPATKKPVAKNTTKPPAKKTIEKK